MSDVQPPYNPLDKRELANSVAQALLTQSAKPLESEIDFIGPGVYAIYYSGHFPAYQRLAEKNRSGDFRLPIYVGKASPTGGRKGGFSEDALKGNELAKRLQDHVASIADAANLDLADFSYRALVVDDIWIDLGERILIDEFGPLWNQVIDGFGNHAPGKGRRNQKKSKWDVIHPGRRWSSGLPQNQNTVDELLAEIDEFLAKA